MENGRLLGYFSPVFGAMTSEKSGNPELVQQRNVINIRDTDTITQTSNYKKA